MRAFWLRVFGAISVIPFGLTFAAVIILIAFPDHLLQHRSVLFWIAAVLSAPFGWHLGARLASDAASTRKTLGPICGTDLVANVYHVGAVIVFAQILCRRLQVDSRLALESLIIGYGILRVWRCASRSWQRHFTDEPLFFTGLCVGTLPNLFFILFETPPFTLLSSTIGQYRLLSIPSHVVVPLLYSSEYWNWFRHQVAGTIVNSLVWGFVFLLIQLALWKRRSGLAA